MPPKSSKPSFLGSFTDSSPSSLRKLLGPQGSPFTHLGLSEPQGVSASPTSRCPGCVVTYTPPALVLVMPFSPGGAGAAHLPVLMFPITCSSGGSEDDTRQQTRCPPWCPGEGGGARERVAPSRCRAGFYDSGLDPCMSETD